MAFDSEEHPWEKIYQKDGRVFSDVFPAFQDAVDRFSNHGVKRILDLGCGNGRHVVGFQKHRFEVTGLDISSTGLSLSQEWLLQATLPIRLIQGDIYRNFPFKDAAFDGLFSTQVIHHALLRDIRHTIKEIWRVMEPGGLAFITVAGDQNRDLNKHKEIEPGTHVPLEGDEKGLPHHLFSIDELRQEFSSFDILEMGTRDEGRVLISWIRKSI